MPASLPNNSALSSLRKAQSAPQRHHNRRLGGHSYAAPVLSTIVRLEPSEVFSRHEPPVQRPSGGQMESPRPVVVAQITRPPTEPRCDLSVSAHQRMGKNRHLNFRCVI
jgi:hypothetical protein